MDIIVKGRHTDVNARFRQHVDAKLARIERLDQRVIRVDVEVSEERNPRQADRRERVELTIRSRGPAIRAEAAAEDRYGALDLALGKLESRLRRSADRRKIHHGSGNRAPAKLARMEALPEPLPPALTAPEGPERETAAADRQPAAEAAGGIPATTAYPEMVAEAEARSGGGRLGRAEEDLESTDEEAPGAEGDLVPIPMDGDCPVVVREKHHKSAPMTIDQALYEMELVGHDFFLFRDKEGGHPSVVYRRRGWNYGVIRLVEE